MEAASDLGWNTNEPIHPKKSVNDNREYLITKLNNGLRLLMIADPTAEKSACAISVRVGSLADPDSSLGLAHFLYHMLFMGSGKFPIHNEYSYFMSKNAGYDNAFTDDIETNYYFDIDTKSFVEGVERMSEFFKSALLTVDCVEKERQAVHEEFVLWTNDDNCRKWGILHEIAHGQFSRFSIGNQSTLNHDKIHSDLKAFYDKHYSANLINAVLLSNLSFEELQKQTKHLLEDIPNKDAYVPKFDVPYLDEHLGKLIRIQSIKEEQTMEFIWVVEELRPLFKHHIDEYLVHILGHEGENSIFEVLKQEGFASSATSYQHHVVHATMIGLEFDLTEEGYEHYEEVYNIVMKYLANLKPSRYVYQELQDRNTLLFEFQDKTDNTTYVHTLAQRMHYYPPANVLNYKEVFEPFNEEHFTRVFKQLTPNRLLVALSSNDYVKDSKVEKYLGAPYRLDPLPKLTKDPLEDLVIPKNLFLPVDTTILPEDKDASAIQPKKLSENVVFLPDKVFRSCKGGISLHVYSNEDKINQELYSNWLEAMLKTHTYSAETLKTNLEYEYGTLLCINFYGFSDVLLKLLKEFPDWIAATTTKELYEKALGLFEIEHETMLQDYQNALLEGTDDVASDYLERVLKGQKNTTVYQDIETLDKLTPEDFLKFAQGYWANARVYWVFVGNFEEKNILDLVSNFETKLKVNSRLEKAELSCLRIDKHLGVELMVPSDDIKTSGAMVYYQYGLTDSRLRVIFELLKTYIKEPFFNELRTLKQLAYLVRTNVDVERGVIGLVFTIVSSNTDASSVGKSMREFITSYLQKFSDQTKEELDTLKQSVLVSLTEPHDSLNDQFEFVNRQVTRRAFLFNGKEKSAVNDVLYRLTKDDIVDVIREILGKSLTVYVVAKCHEESYTQNTVDAVSKFAEVKASHNFYPDTVKKALYEYETLEIEQVPVQAAPVAITTGGGIKQAGEDNHNKHRRIHRLARLAERRF